jgi:anti-sigma factor (TIGR02949 family)
MPCEKVIEQLSAYLDGQLTAAEMEAVRAHVAGCARCRGELEALDRTARAVADLPRLQAPSDLRDQVMAKLDRVAPAEERPARWRMYWGAAAAVALAVVIMLLTSPATQRAGKPATPRRAEPEQVAQVNPGASAGSNAADQKSLPRAADSLAAPALETTGIAWVSSEQIVLPSANPRASYFNAVAVAAKGGWLPPELKKDAAGELSQAGAEQSMHRRQALQLTFRMKRDQVPLLKDALAAAGLQAAEAGGGRAKTALQMREAASRLAYAPARADSDAAKSLTNAAPAAMNVPERSGAAAGSFQQAAAGKEAQRAEPTALEQTAKAEAAEVVQMTLLFPLAENPMPAAAPATDAAKSVTSE